MEKEIIKRIKELFKEINQLGNKNTGNNLEYLTLQILDLIKQLPLNTDNLIIKQNCKKAIINLTYTLTKEVGRVNNAYSFSIKKMQQKRNILNI